jgi:DNA-binding transcriptional ArsR family regulator
MARFNEGNGNPPGKRRNFSETRDDLLCSREALYKLSSTFKVLGHPARIKIFRLLDGNEYSVSEIQDMIGEVQPVTSQHLKIMTDHELLSSRRNGSFVLYTQNKDNFNRKISTHIVNELIENYMDVPAED